MAESVIGITEGSGKFGHTFQRVIGANTVEDGVVILGENYLAGYVLPTVVLVSISTATANSHLLQIMAGASLKDRIRRIEMYQIGLATTAALMNTQLLRLTTAGTGGTSLGSTNPLDPTDAVSGAQSMTLPTVKGTESSMVAGAMPYMMQTVGASAQLNQPILVWDFDRPRTKPLMIAAGAANGICIKNVTAIAAATVGFNIWFDESNF